MLEVFLAVVISEFVYSESGRREGEREKCGVQTLSVHQLMNSNQVGKAKSGHKTDILLIGYL